MGDLDKEHLQPDYTYEHARQDVIASDAVYVPLSRALKLEKPQGSSFHHLIDFMDRKGADQMTLQKLYRYVPLVITHDWSGAFKNAKDFQGDDVVLPFEHTVFEFRLNGLRVVHFAGNAEKELAMIGVAGHWVHATDLKEPYRTLLRSFIASQVRAACIVLEAQIAESSAVTPSRKLNDKRQKAGSMPIKTYHIVDLRNRHRRNRDSVAFAGRSVRLHFRRGHWRYFTKPETGRETYLDGSRTRIPWTLVGDPDLGFVDKEYRL